MIISQVIVKKCVKIKCFKSQYNYYLQVWMCHSRVNNRKINRLHERYEKDVSVSIHKKNIQILAMEMLKKIKNKK